MNWQQWGRDFVRITVGTPQALFRTLIIVMVVMFFVSAEFRAYVMNIAFNLLVAVAIIAWVLKMVLPKGRRH